MVDTTEGARWPVFRLLNANGQLVEGVPEPALTEELSVKMYTSMVQIQVLDDIMNLAQRQGRISFYMQASGEEAIHVGMYLYYIATQYFTVLLITHFLLCRICFRIIS